jgi:Flp pilus assembly pilin Flp
MMVARAHPSILRARDLCSRFVREDSGQDLIEYAILTLVVTLSSLLVFVVIRNKMENAYETWQTRGQERWVPDPAIVTP